MPSRTLFRSKPVFSVIADSTRRRMLDLLLQCERSVGDLTIRFRMSQPAISQHLRVLRRAGLVSVRRQGRRRLYRLNPEPIERVYSWSRNFVKLTDPAGHAWGIGELKTGVQAMAAKARLSHPSSTTGFQVWVDAHPPGKP